MVARIAQVGVAEVITNKLSARAARLSDIRSMVSSLENWFAPLQSVLPVVLHTEENGLIGSLSVQLPSLYHIRRSWVQNTVVPNLAQDSI